eukprot:Blabericola_migrator_1__8069@NODE_414_length_8710_cov_194_115238_g326_i0_p6_GENE_NODE_414_length_8710_cov_194_115238_g326_i0NODE_414_length_8710_cov_194_115238_g326_i0_p6_ORF_typecomplete_len170_score28_28RRM_1/PF00076_22/9_5e05RRM_1/PF00076_22/8_7e03RRM_1/PF00076_22/5e03_NODE_414_length_8710_cov_194_115238_g326_i049385447
MKPGVIYLSSLPRGMTVMRVQEEMGRFGRIGRTYMQPRGGASEITKSKQQAESGVVRKGPPPEYVQGWVEFLNKNDAKECALILNNQPVERRSIRDKCAGQLWNIRYLHKFTWEDLKAYSTVDRMTRKRRAEVAIEQLTKESDIFYDRLASQARRERKKRKKSSPNPNI